MTVLLSILAGLAVASVLLVASRDLLELSSLQRENYRGHRLPTAVGALLVLAALGVEGGRALLAAAGVGEVATAPRLLVLSAVAGFGFLGLLDDLLGDGEVRGLRGHVLAAGRGRVTTGFLKLAGGAALALVLVAAADATPGWQVPVDGAVVALAANLGNLLDRGPGRALKWALLSYVPLAVVAGAGATGQAAAMVAGSGLALLPGDLRERHMLGDTGANALGAGLGMAAVLSLGEGARIVVALVLLALTLLSEVVSFGRVIDATGPLRLFDRAGRLPDPGPR